MSVAYTAKLEDGTVVEERTEAEPLTFVVEEGARRLAARATAAAALVWRRPAAVRRAAVLGLAQGCARQCMPVHAYPGAEPKEHTRWL